MEKVNSLSPGIKKIESFNGSIIRMSLILEFHDAFKAPPIMELKILNRTISFSDWVSVSMSQNATLNADLIHLLAYSIF